MSRPYKTHTELLARYFERYPERSGGLLSRLARRGEAIRLQIVSLWIPETSGRSLLDAGCGDGEFVHRLLRGRLRFLKLEDIAAKWVAIAGKRLSHSAELVETEVTDLCHSRDGRKYDIVLALGVFDYAPDWKIMMNYLINRSRYLVILDCPKSGVLYNFARRSWLRLQGIRMHTARLAELRSLLRSYDVEAQIHELPLQYLVRIRIGSESQTVTGIGA